MRIKTFQFLEFFPGFAPPATYEVVDNYSIPVGRFNLSVTLCRAPYSFSSDCVVDIYPSSDGRGTKMRVAAGAEVVERWIDEDFENLHTMLENADEEDRRQLVGSNEEPYAFRSEPDAQ